MEIFKNIKEILELCNEELVKNNKETSVTLDYEDLLELKELYNQIKEFYEGNLYTAKQLKNIERDRNKYFIHKSKLQKLIKKYKCFEWKCADDKYWANRIIKGFEELLEERN